MRRLIYIFFLFGLTIQTRAQTYNSIVSDSIIENFMVWEIDNSGKYSTDSKFFKKKVNTYVIHWDNAIISLIESAISPNSFENQFEQMIYQDKSYSSTYYKELKRIPEIVDEADIDFLKLQYENAERNKQWKFNSEKVRLKRNSNNNYYTYSTPLFNKEYTIAILYKEFFCGSVCAYGHLNIYMKENGQWKLYKSIFCWQS